MSGRLLEWDPYSRTQTRFHEEGDGFLIEQSTDVTAVIEHNKARMAETDERARYGDLTMVAAVPLDIWFREVVMTGRDKDEKATKRWLNDRDRSAFKVRPGVI